MKTKDEIYKLRLEKKSYREIEKILNVSRATISYHCKNLGLNEAISNGIKINNIDIDELNEYYKSHTTEETAKKFKISRTTVVAYVDNKRTLLSDEEIRIKNYQKVKNRRQKLKEMGVEYLGGKCMKCGYNKCIWALDFHHRDPKEKEFGIGAYNNLAWFKIMTELDKCDLLCANCHRELHHQNWDVSPLPDKQSKG